MILKIFHYRWYFIIGLSVSLISNSALAWDATGHHLIAWIAYQYLTPTAKSKIDALTASIDAGYPPLQRFIYLSVLPDQLRNNNITEYNSWHFINYPFTNDNTAMEQPISENVVWAIQHSKEKLLDPAVNDKTKAKMLGFLIHFVGDAHQPLHCVNYFSRQFPDGDQGGNFYKLANEETPNLHMLWDQGVGLFKSESDRYPLNNKKVKQLAQAIEQRYPTNYFHDEINDMSPTSWAQKSFAIARTFAYSIPENSIPTEEYIQEGQQITAKQIALSGYRLAKLLNSLFDKDSSNGGS